MTNWTTTVIWPVVKTTFFILYLNLFRLIRWQRYAIYLGLFVNWTFYTIAFIATMYFTAPSPGESWQASFSSPRYAMTFDWTIPIASGSLVLDVYILILPMISVWTLQMNPRKKLGVLAVFATGLT